MQTQNLWPGGPRFRQAEHFRLGTDSILLADFVKTDGAVSTFGDVDFTADES